MNKAQELLEEIVDVKFGDQMAEFVKRIQKLKIVKSIDRTTTGREKFPTIDIKLKDGDVFTIDHTDKGFYWMDFNVEEFLGKSPVDAFNKFKKKLDAGLEPKVIRKK